MKRLILLYDGTWNDQNTRTNVFEFQRSLNKQWSNQTDLDIISACPPGSVEQQVWYDPGVGTHWYDHIRGGGFGFGISRNIRQGYQFISDRWEPGDEICVFGFSRGAYTARSLVGFIRRWGLLRNADEDTVESIYNLYRSPQEAHEGSDERKQWDRTIQAAGSNYVRLVKINVVGVWDTVGSLGIPTSKGISRLFTNAPFSRGRYAFHDTKLSGIVENAFHALAVDEFRPDFLPTLWTRPAADAPAPKEAMPFTSGETAMIADWRSKQQIEQRWFPGCHTDVGGGYPDCDANQREIAPPPLDQLLPGPLGFNLKYESLAWMQRCAKHCGLRFDFDFVPRPDNSIRALMHNPMASLSWKIVNFIESNKARPRPVRRVLLVIPTIPG